MDKITELKQQLADSCKIVFQEGLVKHGEGNVSIRVSSENELIITPTGNNYSNPEPFDMVHMDFNGRRMDGKSKPSSEYFMHRAIYHNRPKVKCILHTHSPFAASLAVSHKAIPLIIEEMALFLGGAVNCAAFASAGSEALPHEALKAMGDQNAVLLANHGVLVLGKTLDYCIKTAVIIEKMAQIYINSCIVGNTQVLPDEKVEQFKNIFRERYSTI